jgi:hypothetical protein
MDTIKRDGTIYTRFASLYNTSKEDVKVMFELPRQKWLAVPWKPMLERINVRKSMRKCGVTQKKWANTVVSL